MTISAPPLQGSQPQQMLSRNFVALQSAQLSVSNSGASGSQSVTFTNLPPGGTITTLKITNTGSSGCYVASGKTTATAVISTGTPSPSSGTNAISNCDYIAAGAILTQDYIGGTDTLAAICASTGTTTLEISVGYGQ